MEIRRERPADHAVIDEITAAAFATVPYGTDHDSKITGLLRADGALSLSLVAVDAGAVLGHVAFSPVEIGEVKGGWFCLGPISVRPDHHGKGIGGAMIRAGLAALRQRGASGVILMGSPDYYGRFGFRVAPGLRLEGEASPYLQSLGFDDVVPDGEVRFHPAFTEP